MACKGGRQRRSANTGNVLADALSKQDVCGDGICGFSESSDADREGSACPEDCPYPYLTCPRPGSEELPDSTKVSLPSLCSVSPSALQDMGNVDSVLAPCTRLSGARAC